MLFTSMSPLDVFKIAPPIASIGSPTLKLIPSISKESSEDKSAFNVSENAENSENKGDKDA